MHRQHYAYALPIQTTMRPIVDLAYVATREDQGLKLSLRSCSACTQLTLLNLQLYSTITWRST